MCVLLKICILNNFIFLSIVKNNLYITNKTKQILIIEKLFILFFYLGFIVAHWLYLSYLITLI